MTLEFVNFLNLIKARIQNGDIRVTKPITDFDIAVKYATAKILEEKGANYPITTEEITEKILDFAPELLG